MKQKFGWLLAIPCTLIFAGAAMAQDHAAGKVKICQIQGFSGTSQQPLYIPSDGTYTGGCDSDGNNCRDILIGNTRTAYLNPGKNACIVLDTILLHDDGQPVSTGQKLVPNWETGNFESTVVVTQGFK